MLAMALLATVPLTPFRAAAQTEAMPQAPGLDALGSMSALALAQADPGPIAPIPSAQPDTGIVTSTQVRDRTGSFGEQAGSAWRELAFATAVITVPRAISLTHGSAGFHFTSEGWFGKKRASAGTDKLMHAFEAHVLADFLDSAIRRRSDAPSSSQFTAGIISFGLMTYAEVFDGFGDDHGFSHEDVIADLAGASFSVLRASIPGLRDKLDFRIQYIPTDLDSFHPLTDYAGQKFMLSLELAGFRGLRDTPLRFVELHAGYYARGISAEDRMQGERVRRKPFVGIGLNVKELLFPHPRTRVGRFAGSVLDYVHIPYTAVRSD
jgi:hypothetical protein